MRRILSDQPLRPSELVAIRKLRRHIAKSVRSDFQFKVRFVHLASGAVVARIVEISVTDDPPAGLICSVCGHRYVDPQTWVCGACGADHNDPPPVGALPEPSPKPDNMRLIESGQIDLQALAQRYLDAGWKPRCSHQDCPETGRYKVVENDAFYCPEHFQLHTVGLAEERAKREGRYTGPEQLPDYLTPEESMHTPDMPWHPCSECDTYVPAYLDQCYYHWSASVGIYPPWPGGAA